MNAERAFVIAILALVFIVVLVLVLRVVDGDGADAALQAVGVLR